MSSISLPKKLRLANPSYALEDYVQKRVQDYTSAIYKLDILIERINKQLQRTQFPETGRVAVNFSIVRVLPTGEPDHQPVIGRIWNSTHRGGKFKKLAADLSNINSKKEKAAFRAKAKALDEPLRGSLEWHFVRGLHKILKPKILKRPGKGPITLRQENHKIIVDLLKRLQKAYQARKNITDFLTEFTNPSPPKYKEGQLPARADLRKAMAIAKEITSFIGKLEKTQLTYDYSTPNKISESFQKIKQKKLKIRAGQKIPPKCPERVKGLREPIVQARLIEHTLPNGRKGYIDPKNRNFYYDNTIEAIEEGFERRARSRKTFASARKLKAKVEQRKIEEQAEIAALKITKPLTKSEETEKEHE